MKLLVVVGVVVLLAGLSLILNAFHIHLPLFRIAAGAAISWLGLSLLLSGIGVDHAWMAVHPRQAPASVPQATAERQDVIFAERDLDLTHLDAGEHLHLGVIFGDVTVRYDPRQPIELRATTAFGNTAFPDGTDIAFGERTLRTAACESEKAHAIVDINTVFGTTRLLPVLP